MTDERVFVALGSNLGDRTALIGLAIERLGQLPKTQVVAVGPIIENPALLPPDDPTPQPDFLNTVAELRTTLEPLELLAAFKGIERALGRTSSTRWAARPIDLDLVLYGARVIDSAALVVPHPGLASRSFVRVPLLALWPAAIDPRSGARLADG